MDSETASRVNLILKINGSENIPCQLKRHLSPITVGLIMRMLPLNGNAHQIGKSIVYFETSKKTDFKKGDMAFLPAEGSICIYINDVYDGKPMTVIGKINETDKLNEVKPSDILSLSRN